LQYLLKKAIEDHQRGLVEEAGRLYRQILQKNPRHPDALHLLGLINQQKGMIEQAEVLIRKAIFQDNKSPLFNFSLGNVLAQGGKSEESINIFRRVLSLEPNFLEAHYNLANELYKIGSLEESIAHYQKAIRINPRFAEGYYNLGKALEKQDKPAEAEACYRKALFLNPEYYDALFNLSIVLSDQCKLREAEECYRQAMAMNPGDAEAIWNLSLVLLLSGNLKEGWEKYEWRLQQAKYHFLRSNAKRWQGELAPEKTILIRAEQGLGDVIQFMRFLPGVKSRVGTVFFECQPALFRLLQNIKGIDRLFQRNSELSPPDVGYDLDVPLLSLPSIFQLTPESIPADIPYLSPDPDLVTEWGNRLPASDGKMRIGIVWAGYKGHKGNTKRSTRLAMFSALGNLAKIHFFSLQIGEASVEAENLPPVMGLIDLTASIHDFADTAAIISHLDLVISVDTAVAHLAGAMGKPVWTLLPFAPDWRWQLAREDTPWYPTMRLFRQKGPGSWGDVFAEVSCELAKMRS
jgi:tetratricopeptide (TPR) repeat protein